ncbi:MAG: hypothetical protein LUF90_03220, partial [Rikenellaceae bacterium]|nr:hypothetical protein [Rikenellaceae bacterium]
MSSGPPAELSTTAVSCGSCFSKLSGEVRQTVHGYLNYPPLRLINKSEVPAASKPPEGAAER